MLMVRGIPVIFSDDNFVWIFTGNDKKKASEEVLASILYIKTWNIYRKIIKNANIKSYHCGSRGTFTSCISFASLYYSTVHDRFKATPTIFIRSQSPRWKSALVKDMLIVYNGHLGQENGAGAAPIHWLRAMDK